jgi:predicted nucleic acid-binding protein
MTTFVDSGVWFASVIPTDPRHRDVAEWHLTNNSPLLTTDCVVDETLTLLRARGERTRSIELGHSFFDLGLFTIHRVSEDDLQHAWRTFRDQPDRSWSFTDCTSKAVIERLHIKRALTFDRHLVEFGVSTIVP